MEKERIPRGSDPRRNFKMGPGGTSDIEFSAQILQLRHAAENEELQVTGTLDALRGAGRAGLLAEEDATRLIDAYLFLAALRNRWFFMAGRPVEDLPPAAEKLEALGVALGYKEQPRQELEEDYLRVTRRTRKIAQRIIYG
jgi:glutamate-ammonia-ligase adenylyltransferase